MVAVDEREERNGVRYRAAKGPKAAGVIEGPWDAGSPLREGVHDRLVDDRAYYARLAGVEEAWLWQPLLPHVGPKEARWVREYRRLAGRGVRGVLYVGDAGEAATRMRAICGALVRNFVDARLRRLGEVLRGDGGGCSALFVPDLALGPEGAPDWMRREAAGLLQERVAAGQQTVVYARDAGVIERSLGDVVAEILLDARRFPRLVLGGEA